MGLKFQVWWLTVRQHPVRSSIAFAFVLLAAFALLVYLFGWNWTGFNGGFSQVTTTTSTAHGTTIATVQQPSRTLWDLLQLLIIPIMLAVGGFWLNNLQKRREEKTTEQRAEIEREIAKDNQYEAILKEYFEKMSELLLHENLRESKPKDEVRKVAKLWTALTVTRVDQKRKRHVIDLLQISELIEADNIIDMSGIVLRGATLAYKNLIGLNLSRTNLSEANLRESDLSGADLSGANLSNADLQGANLSNTNLSNTNLSNTNLRRAIVTTEQLDKAKSLKGATMPDGSTHP